MSIPSTEYNRKTKSTSFDGKPASRWQVINWLKQTHLGVEKAADYFKLNPTDIYKWINWY